MRFITAIVALAATAAAAPGIRRWSPMDQISVQEANDACGNNLELHCCNKETDQAAGHGDVSKNPGVIGGILDSASIFDQCSKLSVAALIGVQDLLNTHCTAKAVCCQRSPSNAAGGLINAGLPCIALGSLIQ
ncbi:fungal hydrophobin domain-containing protein [Purpureocillium lavendulum]|uniref:Hydrophobin n=1 Tax=Purpureocillium lavendulum TaxID=1247861 RepID=A0AB34FE55_9HYPO|nr:fungal hydrophobin domain-containing protein [Purpureocillium lavendulum]